MDAQIRSGHDGLECGAQRHSTKIRRRPTWSGDPVSWGFSIPSQASPEYWIVRSSRTMTA